MAKGQLEKIVQWTSDGWNNVLTGLGRLGKDKRMSNQAHYKRISQREVEELYSCDDMARKVVDTLPGDMIREGFEIKAKDESADLTDGVIGYLDERAGKEKIEEGLVWGRLYGGAVTIMGIDDGNEPDQPVNENNIRGIDYFNNVNRWELHPIKIQNDPASPNFGEPEVYRIQPITGGAFTAEIHRDRILRWPGAKLPRRLFIENNYWDDSVLNTLENPLRNFQSSHDSVASVMQDFAQAVFKLKGLSEMIAQGQDGLVQKRLAMVDSMRSVTKAIIIEDDEEFERKVTSLQGVPDTLKTIDQRLVQASGMPHTILLGESPSGLGATGNSEIRDWYDYVSRQQEKILKPQIERLMKYIFLAEDGPTSGQEPPEWKIEFNPLWQMDEKQQAEIRKMVAETDEKYIVNQVLSPDEVRESRFGGTDFNTETELSAASDARELFIVQNQDQYDGWFKQYLIDRENDDIESEKQKKSKKFGKKEKNPQPEA